MTAYLYGGIPEGAIACFSIGPALKLHMKTFLVALMTCFVALFASASTLSKSGSISCSHEQLVDSLKHLGGEYKWDANLKRYLFTKKPEIDQILAGYQAESTIATLANCIDAVEQSDTLLGNRKVRVGILCFEALTQLIYYEPKTSNGDVAQKWPGYINPNASLEQLRRAKRAWIVVIKSKSYSKL